MLSQWELSVARRAGEKSYFDPSLTFYKHSPISLHEEGPVLRWDSIPPKEADASCRLDRDTSRASGSLEGQRGLAEGRSGPPQLSPHLSLHQLPGGLLFESVQRLRLILSFCVLTKTF